jgi:hypothetical protein
VDDAPAFPKKLPNNPDTDHFVIRWILMALEQRGLPPISMMQFVLAREQVLNDRPGILAAWDVGLGKTRAAVVSAALQLWYGLARRVVVVTTKTVVPQFLEAFVEMDFAGLLAKMFGAPVLLSDYVQVVTVDDLMKAHGKNKLFSMERDVRAAARKEAVAAFDGTFMVFDESHIYRTPIGNDSGQRTKLCALLRNIAACPAAFIDTEDPLHRTYARIWAGAKALLLTATPVFNDPYDIAMQRMLIMGILESMTIEAIKHLLNIQKNPGDRVFLTQKERDARLRGFMRGLITFLREEDLHAFIPVAVPEETISTTEEEMLVDDDESMDEMDVLLASFESRKRKDPFDESPRKRTAPRDDSSPALPASRDESPREQPQDDGSSDFPAVEVETLELTMTRECARDYHRQLDEMIKKHDGRNTFWSNERMLSNMINNLKAAEILKHILDCISNTSRSFGVYSSFIDAGCEIIKNHLAKNGIPFVVVEGKTSKEDRIDAVRRFNDGEVRVIIFSSAGGVGMNLLRCTDLYTLEPVWTDAAKSQIIGRIRRRRALRHLPKDKRIARVYCMHIKMPDGTRTGDDITAAIAARKQPSIASLTERLRKMCDPIVVNM